MHAACTSESAASAVVGLLAEMDDDLKSYQVWRPDDGDRMGHLPQGAPTSPMLANLAVREFDELVSEIAAELVLSTHGMQTI